MLRASLLAGGLAAALLSGCGGAGPGSRAVAPWPARPNLVLISIDSLRPDHLGLYGYPRATSPELDRFAAGAVVFERAWSVSSWTLPAHLTMLSSLPPPVHGVRHGGDRINDAVVLLPEALAGAGYRSAAVVSGLFLDRRFGYDQGWEVYDDRTAFGHTDIHEHANVSSERVHRRAVELLDRLAPGPYFLFVHFFDVHYDYVPPPPYDRMFDPDYAGTLSGANFARDVLKRHQLPARDLAHLEALYDGEIRWVDGWLGRLFAELDRRGHQRATMVVVVADHGEEFLEHHRLGHAKNLYEPTLRVPLLVRLPGERPAGRRLAVPVSLLDLAPTLAAAAGVAPPAAWMGRNLLPLLRGAGEAPPADLYADLFGSKRAVIVDGTWKGILSRLRKQKQPRNLELYRIADRLETDDRAGAEAERAADLRQRLDRAYRLFARASAGIRAGHVAQDADFERELRALGYL